MDILNLHGLIVTNVNDTESETNYYITATSSNPVICCHSCGVIKPNNVNLSKFGKRKFVYMYLPIHAKRVVIGVDRQRYKCRECDSTFFEKLSDCGESKTT